MAATPIGEQLALFEAPALLWPGGPDPRSLAREEVIEGGAFEYGRCREVFFGRQGAGPLRVALDTSVLIDYADFGSAIWADGPFKPDVPDPGYRDQLVALAEIMNLWTMRDIRLHVFDRQRTDNRRSMSVERVSMRETQIVQLQSALRCLGHDTVDMRPPAGTNWPERPRLTGLPASVDRELVELAVEAGCHVFLTCDKALLRKAAQVDACWLVVLSPVDLLDLLAAAGEVGLAATGDWLLPDTHKLVHVMGACKAVP